MHAKECRATRREIDQSELGLRLSEQAEAHLAGCRHCAGFRAERSRLRELVASLGGVSAPPDFDVRLRARIARERDSHPRSLPWIFRFAMSIPGIAVAAVLVLTVGGIVWFGNRSEHLPVPVAGQNPQPAPSVGPEIGVAATAATHPEPAVASDSTDTRDLGSQLASRRGGNRSAGSTVAPQSSDFTVSGARSFRLNPDRAGEVSLTAPVSPMVVSVYDEDGGKRQILLPPISFGAQRLTDNRTNTSVRNTRDW